MKKGNFLALFLSLFVTMRLFAVGITDNQITRKSHSQLPTQSAVQANDDLSKLVIYKRLYQKEKTRTFGKVCPALTPQAITHKLGKKMPKAGGDKPLTVFGTMAGNSTWGDKTQYGMYTFTAPAYTSTLVKQEDDLVANGGGVLVGDTYYLTNFYTYYGYNFVYFERYNPETWEFLGDTKASMQEVATDLAYDPITDKVYGCFVSDSGNGYVWGTIDLTEGKRTQLGFCDNPLLAIAASNEGIIYGIDGKGNLYTVDKETGAQTLVGSTGLSVEYITQSATFDTRKNEMYWAACLSGGKTGFYKVNTTTGEATEVIDFPNKEQYLGLFIKAPLAEDGAPAAVASVITDFKNGSCTGDIKFTAPTTTFAGDALTGELTYEVKANGKSVATGTTTAGADVDVEVTLPGGATKISVTTANAEGNSPAAVVDMFIGKDAPTAVGDLKLEVTDRDNGMVKLTWTAPTTTLNGGYLDAAAMRYKVVRNTDGKEVANDLSVCEFTEKLGTEALAQYSYTVTPYVGDLIGTEAVSNGVKLGTHCLVPYLETFDTKEALDNFTIIDGYEDGDTWMFRNGWDMVQSRYSFKNPMDEWLMTPPIYLEKGKLYKLTFTSSCKRVYPDRLEVKMGKGTSVADMVTTLVKDTLYQTDQQIPDVVYDFDLDVKVDESGDYHIGFHAMTDEPQMSDLRLDDISLTYVSDLGCPDRVSDLTATPGANGALNATISFTTPAKTFEGDALTNITKAEIYKNDILEATIENPGVGKPVSVVVDADQGMNEYKVYTYNENGKSLDSKVSVYCGVSIPSPVSNVVLKEENSHPVITWDAPTVGADGGYIDPSKLTYIVLRGSDQTVVASDISETSFIDDEVDGQTLQVYLVYASNAAGMSQVTYSNYIVVGNGRYTVPFCESFGNATITQQPWGNVADGSSSWWLTKDGQKVKTYDDDGGMIYFMGEGPNETGRIFSGKISLANTSHPALVTHLYYDESLKGDVKVRIMATTDYVNYTTLKEVDYNNFDGETGWNEFTVSLDEYKDKPWVAVAYDATTGVDYKHSVYLDKVEVIDNIENNITAVAFQGPASMLAGNEADFTVTWRNDGLKTAENYTVELYQNGKKLQQVEGEAIKPGEAMSTVFHVMPDAIMPEANEFYAYINYEADEYKDNNTSKVQKSVVNTVDYPTVENISGKYENGAQITWDKPAAQQRVKAVTEDFDSYEPFIITNIGNWKLYDGDGTPTFCVQFKGSVKQYKNAGEPMAWQVFNAHDAGLDDEATGYDIFMAHSGTQSLASFSSETGTSDNWLISPKLSGSAQLISFYVRTSVPNFGMEKFEVLTSTTDDEVESFTKIENIDGNAPYAWTKISFAVPSGTQYFAIRCVSSLCMAMLVDDITYTPAEGEMGDLNIVGYNIYRDGVKLNEVPVAEPTYTDAVEPNTSYQYQVSVVYEEGESKLSAPFVLSTTTINTFATRGISIETGNRMITVNNCAGKSISIFGTDGAVVYSGVKFTESVSVSVAKGAYIVEYDGKRKKVVVK